MFLFYLLIFLLLGIYQVASDLDNFGNEKYALLILAAANNDGKIAKKGNDYIKVKNCFDFKDPNPKYETIVDIIPALRELYDNDKSCSSSGAPRTKSCQAVDTYFKNNLYNSAIRCYNKYFSNSANANNVINKYDIDPGISIIPESGVLIKNEKDYKIYDRNSKEIKDRIKKIGKQAYKIDNNNIHISRAT
ncbi:hypothetical protein U3516DRAFT_573090, partial [Neocallimastix sp. 'constans']